MNIIKRLFPKRTTRYRVVLFMKWNWAVPAEIKDRLPVPDGTWSGEAKAFAGETEADIIDQCIEFAMQKFVQFQVPVEDIFITGIKIKPL